MLVLSAYILLAVDISLFSPQKSNFFVKKLAAQF